MHARALLSAVGAAAIAVSMAAQSPAPAPVVPDLKPTGGRGLTEVHPFDDPDVIAGQGTVGLELVAQLPEVGTVLVPVGGGGLVAGIAAAVKAHRPGVRVVGVQAEGAGAFAASLATASERRSSFIAASPEDMAVVEKVDPGTRKQGTSPGSDHISVKVGQIRHLGAHWGKEQIPGTDAIARQTESAHSRR